MLQPPDHRKTDLKALGIAHDASGAAHLATGPPFPEAVNFASSPELTRRALKLAKARSSATPISRAASDPYKSLRTTLQAEIDEEAWASLKDPLAPVSRPVNGRVAVKVMNDLENEVMKVTGV